MKYLRYSIGVLLTSGILVGMVISIKGVLLAYSCKDWYPVCLFSAGFIALGLHLLPTALLFTED